MSLRKSFGQQRLAALRTWAEKAEVPGMDQPTYVAIFDFILQAQQDDGAWNMGGNNWTVVMTSVILKALSALQFTREDRWSLAGEPERGLALAINYLQSAVVQAASRPEAIGEDIWDACQAALALREFAVDMPSSETLAGIIDADWEILYSSACQQSRKNRWCGPAYLAAIVDVMARWEAELGKDNHFEIAFDFLKGLESREQNQLFGFRATAPRDDMDLWTTALVLRTLSTVPDAKEHLVDRNQIQRVAVILLDRLDARWGVRDAEAPMLLARSLHGLRRARSWVDGHTRDRIDATVERGNESIANFFSAVPRIGDLKAYTAVAEYLADWGLRAPAGLIFHAAKGLGSSSVLRAEPEIVDGGLRVAWLSDLHVAAQDEQQPARFNPVQKWAGAFMHFKGTPLTQYFQQRNVQTILRRLQELKYDHILVSGDVTNYATAGQFKFVRDEFLNIQAGIPNVDGTPRPASLDPQLWTILPGNHDVTTENRGSILVRRNLGMFLENFGESYSRSDCEGGDEIYPLRKVLRGRKSFFKLQLLGLDSTVTSPVWHVGVNARGRIDANQLKKLARLLNEKVNVSMTFVALHHHPLVVPEMISAAEDFFLSLNESDGRKLVQLCASSGVSAILHGHFHRFSSWSGLVGSGRQMVVIGSSAGSLTVPDTAEEFLEIREAEQETPGGVQRGLGLYRQHYQSGGWVQQFTGIFLPSRTVSAS